MEGIIFDLDGTLIDSLPAIGASVNHALKTHNCATHDLATIRGFIGDGARALIERALGESTSATLEAVLTSFREHYSQNWRSGTRPYSGINQVLTTCQQKGIQIAVLSNKPHSYTQTIVKELFSSAPFNPIWGQRDTMPQKPDPNALELILERWKLDPKRCCMVGDSVIDIQTAQRANITAIGVSWGYHDYLPLIAATPQLIFETVPDLHLWLNGLEVFKTI